MNTHSEQEQERVCSQCGGCQEACAQRRCWGFINGQQAFPGEIAWRSFSVTQIAAENISVAQHIKGLEERLKKAEELNVFFRDSVGECHVMISRDTPEFQITKSWDSIELPARLQKLMKERLLNQEHYQNAMNEVRAHRQAVSELNKRIALLERDNSCMRTHLGHLANTSRRYSCEFPVPGGPEFKEGDL